MYWPYSRVLKATLEILNKLFSIFLNFKKQANFQALKNTAKYGKVRWSTSRTYSRELKKIWTNFFNILILTLQLGLTSVRARARASRHFTSLKKFTKISEPEVAKFFVVLLPSRATHFFVFSKAWDEVKNSKTGRRRSDSLGARLNWYET